MPVPFKTLVVVATTCMLLALVVTYTVGQSDRSGGSETAAAPPWKADNGGEPIPYVPEAPAPGDQLSPEDSAAFWSRDMGASPRELFASDRFQNNSSTTKLDTTQPDTAQREVANTASQNAPAGGNFAGTPDVPRRVSPELTAQANEFLTTMQNLESRLQKLGATYYRLESSEDSAKFRFHCEMPLAEQPGFHRFFEADAPSPEAAMERVIGAVETWLAARSEQ